MELPAAEIQLRDYLRFVGTVMVAHMLTYIAVGTLTYELIYESAIDAGGFDTFMRNPNNPEEWQHVLNWLLPAQILRGVLFGIALCPFLRTLSGWKLSSRFWALLALLLVFSVWSVTMPAEGSIEGWVYLRPDSGPTLPNPLLGYIEVPIQLASFAFLVSWRIGRSRLCQRSSP